MEVMDEKLDTSWQWAPTGLESQMCPGLPPKKCGSKLGEFKLTDDRFGLDIGNSNLLWAWEKFPRGTVPAPPLEMLKTGWMRF